MPNSICPKGWRLPPNDDINGEKKSYNNLIRTAYGITATDSDTTLLSGSANSAMSFVHLGHYNDASGSLEHRGNWGVYWFSTAYNSTHSHNLYFTSWTLNPQIAVIGLTVFLSVASPANLASSPLLDVDPFLKERCPTSKDFSSKIIAE